MPNVISLLPHILEMGTREPMRVRDLAHASRNYSAIRDLSGEGASSFPEGSVKIGTKRFRISYNGRVWDGKTCVLEAQR